MVTLLRFFHLMSMTIWVGMIVFFSFFAAPSIFKTLPRETAGDVVGHIFPKYWMVGYAAAIVSLATLITIGFISKSFPTLRIILLVVMTAVTFYSGLVVGKNAQEIKAEIRATDDEGRKTELRANFKRVHAVSAVLNMIVLALGTVVIFLIARETLL